jgi:hypothetical protein
MSSRALARDLGLCGNWKRRCAGKNRGPSTLFLSPFARRESARDDKKWFWEDRAVFIELMFALKAVRAAAFERNRFRHLQKRAGRVRKTGRLAVDQPQFPVKT